VARYVNLVPL